MPRVKKPTKAKEPIYLPLSHEALKWMPEHEEKTSEEHVFDLPSPTMINTLLKPCEKADGIDKRFSFHCSRHKEFYFSLKFNSLQNISA